MKDEGVCILKHSWLGKGGVGERISVSTSYKDNVLANEFARHLFVFISMASRDWNSISIPPYFIVCDLLFTHLNNR